VRFRTHAAREIALAIPYIMFEDVRITLQREELAGRTPLHAKICVLLQASPLAAEHVNPEGIVGLFTKFGEVLEIDPVCVMGRDMSSVKLVLLMDRARDIPNDLWPRREPWGCRPIQVEIVRVWPMEDSLQDGSYQSFFATVLGGFGEWWIRALELVRRVLGHRCGLVTSYLRGHSDWRGRGDPHAASLCAGGCFCRLFGSGWQGAWAGCTSGAQEQQVGREGTGNVPGYDC
jgi:hypothetical protein